MSCQPSSITLLIATTVKATVPSYEVHSVCFCVHSSRFHCIFNTQLKPQILGMSQSWNTYKLYMYVYMMYG